MVSADLFTGPSASSDSLFQHKLSEFKANNQNTQALFIGSSRVYRGINPIVFDSVLNLKPGSTYNFGVSGFQGAEKWNFAKYLTRGLLLDSVRYVFIEIGSLDTPQNKRIKRNTATGRYGYKTTNFVDDIGFAFSTKATNVSKAKQILNDTKFYLLSRLKFKYWFESRIMNKTQPSEIFLTPKNKHGYYSLEEEWGDGNQSLERRSKLPMRHVLQEENSKELNTFSFERHMDLIEEFKKKGIHLIYLNIFNNPKPELLFESHYLEKIANELPAEHVIGQGDFLELTKHIYANEYFFDRGHFNEEGAKLYTEALASYFKKNIMK